MKGLRIANCHLARLTGYTAQLKAILIDASLLSHAFA